MAKFDDTKILITGGGPYYTEETFIVDTLSDFEITPGPEMQTKRYLHACSSFVYQGEKVVIVAGGYDYIDGSNETPLDSTELCDLRTAVCISGRPIHFCLGNNKHKNENVLSVLYGNQQNNTHNLQF